MYKRLINQTYVDLQVKFIKCLPFEWTKLVRQRLTTVCDSVWRETHIVRGSEKIFNYSIHASVYEKWSRCVICESVRHTKKREKKTFNLLLCNCVNVLQIFRCMRNHLMRNRPRYTRVYSFYSFGFYLMMISFIAEITRDGETKRSHPFSIWFDKKESILHRFAAYLSSILFVFFSSKFSVIRHAQTLNENNDN